MQRTFFLTIFFLLLSFAVFSFSLSVSHAESCSSLGDKYMCKQGASCPTGFELGGGDCSTDYVCCKSSNVTSGGSASSNFPGWNVKTVGTSSGLPSGKIADIIISFMEWLLGIFAFIAIIGFLIAGVWYLTAAGDEGRIDTAKRAMIYSIIGVLVGLVGLVILFAVSTLLSGNNSFF